jgi:hypothetical protein
MRTQKETSTPCQSSQAAAANEDFSLEGFQSVLPKLQRTRSAAYFLNPTRSTHYIDFAASMQVKPADAFKDLFKALQLGVISPCDLAESVVASRPSSVEECKAFLKTKISSQTSRRALKLNEAIGECIQELDALIALHLQGDFNDALFRRSLESLINYSGVLGELGKGGSINGAFYGPYCRRYDRIQAFVRKDGSLELHGFSTEPWQLAKVHDLVADLKAKGVITQSIGMSREEFASAFELTGGEIMKRGAYVAVGMQLGALGVNLASQDTYAIQPNSSTHEVLKKVLELVSVLHGTDMADITKQLEDVLGANSLDNFDEALKSAIPDDAPPERLEHARWMLEELHDSLHKRYRARFHNEDKSTISDDGTLKFEVSVDHHREDYASIVIDRRSVSPQAYRIIFDAYVSTSAQACV